MNSVAFLKTCSACNISIERKNCHKNRYNEYICRTCQSAGVKLTWRRRLKNLRKKLEKIEPKFWRIAIKTGLAVFVLWMLFRTFESVGS